MVRRFALEGHPWVESICGIVKAEGNSGLDAGTRCQEALRSDERRRTAGCVGKQSPRGARQCSLPLEEIGELLALRIPSGSCNAVERRAQAAMERIEAKLGELTRMRDAISQLVSACRSDHPPDECPMLAALDEAVEDSSPGREASMDPTRRRLRSCAARRPMVPGE